MCVQHATMNYKILILILIVSLVASQSFRDVILGILNLSEQRATHIQPRNYNEFKYPNITSEGKYGVYDFIIIGGGTAGTVLANRLSAISKWKILLLEAGLNETMYTDIPSQVESLQMSIVNWGYQTKPQKTCCLGMNNSQCQVSAGKVLGGSSTINYMIYSRGNKEDYDSWEKANNTGWSYEKILPYFKQMENCSLVDNVDSDFHCTDGTLHVEHVRNFETLGQAFLDANVEKGRRIRDYNGKNQMGFSRIQSNTMNGQRYSGNKAFLNPVILNDNLEVLTEAFVTKINIERKRKKKYKAKKVEFLVGDKKYYATAKLEIILSAGAIGSPQILLHSGIGPKKDLEKLKIKVVKDLSVGKNLHDHPSILLMFNSSYTDPSHKTTFESILDYSKGFGFLTTAGNIQSMGFINSKDENSLVPDLAQLMIPYFNVSSKTFRKINNLKNDTYNDMRKPVETIKGAYMQILLNPKSRGNIKLKSNNIFDHPLINLNHFSNDEDLDTMIKGLKYLISLNETKALKRFNVSISNNPLRACPQVFLSDEYLKCYLQQMATSANHLSGTCKMGPDSDPEAVVNASLRVKGFENLRVIDASIMPSPISGFPTAATYMIAAKGADMIREFYNEACSLDSSAAITRNSHYLSQILVFLSTFISWTFIQYYINTL